ncbi:MAG: hypothetical protein ISS52_07760 [Dehalococcoidia bacterium]|nr:hypothetical protein [Dehalococcoidia bacterium]
MPKQSRGQGRVLGLLCFAGNDSGWAYRGIEVTHVDVVRTLVTRRRVTRGEECEEERPGPRITMLHVVEYDYVEWERGTQPRYGE